MGAITQAIGRAATDAGVEIVTNASVKRILYETLPNSSRVSGVEMKDGSVLSAPTVLSNATPYHTFLVSVSLFVLAFTVSLTP